MMGQSVEVAESMDMATYEGLLHHWAAIHGDDEVEAPDASVVQARLDAINADPRLTH